MTLASSASTVCHNLVRTVAITCINFYKLKFSLNYSFKYSLGFSEMKLEFIKKLGRPLKLF